jgi:hypothetical protein
MAADFAPDGAAGMALLSVTANRIGDKTGRAAKGREH